MLVIPNEDGVQAGINIFPISTSTFQHFDVSSSSEMSFIV